jgi:DNA modification methylase
MIERIVKSSSRPGDVVADPFSGSGTTIIACEQLNRKCRAMEIDPRYVDVAVRRWEKFTGKTAVLER